MPGLDGQEEMAEHERMVEARGLRDRTMLIGVRKPASNSLCSQIEETVGLNHMTCVTVQQSTSIGAWCHMDKNDRTS